MTTKDYPLSDKTDSYFGESKNDQYNNLNLNHNYQSFHSDKIQSKSIFTKSRKIQNHDFTDSNNLPAKKDLNLWNKSDKHLSSVVLNLNCESAEECDFRNSKSANNSTLSLHIAAYENLIEDKADSEIDDSKSKREKTALIKKWNNSKHGLLSFIQNPFEFPRQQQEDEGSHSEVMQFKASQQLRNPNEEHLNFDEKAEKSIEQTNRLPKIVAQNVLQKPQLYIDESADTVAPPPSNFPQTSVDDILQQSVHCDIGDLTMSNDEKFIKIDDSKEVSHDKRTILNATTKKYPNLVLDGIAPETEEQREKAAADFYEWANDNCRFMEEHVQSYHEQAEMEKIVDQKDDETSDDEKYFPLLEAMERKMILLHDILDELDTINDYLLSFHSHSTNMVRRHIDLVEEMEGDKEETSDETFAKFKHGPHIEEGGMAKELFEKIRALEIIDSDASPPSTLFIPGDENSAESSFHKLFESIRK